MLEYGNFFILFKDKEVTIVNLQIPLNIPDIEILNYAPNSKNELFIILLSTKKYTHCHKCNKKIEKVPKIKKLVLTFFLFHSKQIHLFSLKILHIHHSKFQMNRDHLSNGL